MNYVHTQRQKTAAAKKTCPKNHLSSSFAFFPICLFPPSFIFGRPKKESPFFLSFFRTCKPEQLAFHIKYAPFNDALFSKTRKLHIPRFPPPPSEKKGGKWNRIYIPSRFPRPSSSSLPFSPNVKRGKRRRERIHPQKWGGKGNEQMHFYSRFWTQAEFISRVAFSFPLVRELRVEKRVNLFRGGALLNFDIKPSKRIREGFWKWKGIGVNFLGAWKGGGVGFFDATTCCFLPHFFLPKKTLEKISESDFFCATCMRIWCALGNWNSILRSGSCTRVFRSFFSPWELHYFYFFLLVSIWGTVCPEISGLFTQDPKGRKENWASLSISFFFISSAHLDTAFWAHQKMFPTLFLPNHV